MRKEYDFSKAIRNPYASKLKKQITIRIDENVIDYFKNLASEFDMPYQNLINLYLKDCTAEGRKPKLNWIAAIEQQGKEFVHILSTSAVYSQKLRHLGSAF